MSADEPDREEGFLSRWSRRKREIAVEAGKPDEALAARVPESAEAQPPAEPEEEFDLSLLPDIETLTAESDITLFLKKGVPEALKNAALRRMWSADSAIRDYIGPVDYQWDFNDPAGVPGFGPLGSDVDVQALLRQVMGEPAPRPDSAPETADAALTEQAHPPLMEQHAALDGAETAENTPPGLEFSQEPESENAIPATDAPAEAASAPVPRRHGGALPL